MGVVVIVWGVGPPTTKLITASPLIVTFIRFGLSAPFLVASVVAKRVFAEAFDSQKDGVTRNMFWD